MLSSNNKKELVYICTTRIEGTLTIEVSVSSEGLWAYNVIDETSWIISVQIHNYYQQLAVKLVAVLVFISLPSAKMWMYGNSAQQFTITPHRKLACYGCSWRWSKLLFQCSRSCRLHNAKFWCYMPYDLQDTCRHEFFSSWVLAAKQVVLQCIRIVWMIVLFILTKLRAFSAVLYQIVVTADCEQWRHSNTRFILNKRKSINRGFSLYAPATCIPFNWWSRQMRHTVNLPIESQDLDLLTAVEYQVSWSTILATRPAFEKQTATVRAATPVNLCLWLSSPTAQ